MTTAKHLNLQLKPSNNLHMGSNLHFQYVNSTPYSYGF